MRRYTIVINGNQYVVDVQELDAERFTVQLDGEEFEVNLAAEQDLSSAPITPAMLPGNAPAMAAPRALAAAPVSKPVAAAPTTRAAPRPAVGGANAITAPLPGVIATIDVAVGDNVSRGQALLSLEAMKMKNVIRAPRDGVIAEILVTAGQQVVFNDPLVRFAEG
jgi:biotin carboxyl carrier protein